MKPAPLVTVLTATYNGSRYLADTIESVLRQSFTDFEYLIVDNASTDDSRQIADAYAARDARIRVIASTVNHGPAGGLNLAIQTARGKYLANLDHDDLAAPHRLAVQVAVLEANPDLGFVGGWMCVIDENGSPLYTYTRRVTHGEIHWHLMTHCALAHSTTTMRRDLIVAAGGYSADHRLICDYELFSRLRDRTHFQNIPDNLADYRSFSQQASQRDRIAQHLQVLLLRRAIFQEVSGKDLPLESWHNFYRALDGELLADANALFDGAAVAETLAVHYLARYTPGAELTAIVWRDTAIRLLAMAQRHRRQLPQPARELYQRAMAIDPALWQHPETRKELRINHRTRSASVPTGPSIALPPNH